MTFDLPPRLFRAASRRRATVAIGLTLAVLAVAAGCWEEIRYEPSQASTRVEQDRKPTEEEPKAVEPNIEPESVPEATEESPSDPLAGDLFGEEETPADSGAPADAEPAPAGEPTGDMTGAPLSFETAERAVTDNDSAAAEVASPVAPVTPQERLDAWNAASGWSLAVAVAAKGLPTDRYQPYLTDAELAAEAIGVELPAILEAVDEGERETLVAESQRSVAGADLVSAITKRLDASAGATARLAIDSHLLLLTYSTDGADAAAESLEVSAEAAELPGRLWQPLVDSLAEDADFAAVRGAVFALHKAVAAYLEEAARRGGTLPGQ